jgi:hypothetical protein
MMTPENLTTRLITQNDEFFTSQLQRQKNDGRSTAVQLTHQNPLTLVLNFQLNHYIGA